MGRFQWEQQLDEVEALKSMFPSDGELCIDKNSISDLRAAIERDSVHDDDVALHFALQFQVRSHNSVLHE